MGGREEKKRGAAVGTGFSLAGREHTAGHLPSNTAPMANMVCALKIFVKGVDLMLCVIYHIFLKCKDAKRKARRKSGFPPVNTGEREARVSDHAPPGH